MSRELIVTENITLDGVIDGTGNWIDVSAGADRDDMSAVEKQHRDSADAVLLGRVTFSEFESFWPEQTDDTTGVSDYLNSTQKYVVSRTLTDPAWANTTVLNGDLVDEVTALKESEGKAIVATGSIQLVHGLIEADLVDEYRLFVYPVVRGTGARLFEDLAPKVELAEATPFKCGIVLMRYRRA